eukprot:scaffold44161_cov78-Phaeocystis_antarctica.AAC.6
MTVHAAKQSEGDTVLCRRGRHFGRESGRARARRAASRAGRESGYACACPSRSATRCCAGAVRVRSTGGAWCSEHTQELRHEEQGVRRQSRSAAQHRERVCRGLRSS